MAKILKSEIDLSESDWKQLLIKYKLDHVMSESRIRAIWRRMAAYSHPLAWYEEDGTGSMIAAATLGEGVDRLQSEWESHGQLLEAYALDCLVMEALKGMYRVIEADLEQSGKYIREYQFLDMEPGQMEEMRHMITALGADISLKDEGMLHPLKSVVYRGILSRHKNERCDTICKNCRRMDCPHGQSLNFGSIREPGVLKYSYGYQRIFGK